MYYKNTFNQFICILKATPLEANRTGEGKEHLRTKQWISHSMHTRAVNCPIEEFEKRGFSCCYLAYKRLNNQAKKLYAYQQG